MWRRGLLRAFAALPQKPPVRPLWHSAGLCAGLFGALYLSYQGYMRYQLPAPDREKHAEQVRKVAMTPADFAGVRREEDAKEVREKLSDSIVVLYYPTVSGKSEFAKFLKSTESRPTLLVRGRESLEATIAQLYSLGTAKSNITLFQETLSEGLQKLKDPLLILDDVELMPDVLAERIVMLGYRLKKAGIADVLVIAGSPKVLAMARSCGEMQVHLLRDLTESDYLTVARSLGVSESNATSLFASCGPSLEVLLEARKRPQPAAYSQELQQTLMTTLESAFKTKPHLRDALHRTLQTVNPTKPYGDIFGNSEIARLLLSAGLMVEYPNKSARFRNKMCASAAHSFLSSS